MEQWTSPDRNTTLGTFRARMKSRISRRCCGNPDHWSWEPGRESGKNGTEVTTNFVVPPGAASHSFSAAICSGPTSCGGSKDGNRWVRVSMTKNADRPWRKVYQSFRGVSDRSGLPANRNPGPCTNW